jgi:hypothetical protein
MEKDRAENATDWLASLRGLTPAIPIRTVKTRPNSGAPRAVGVNGRLSVTMSIIGFACLTMRRQ